MTLQRPIQQSFILHLVPRSITSTDLWHSRNRQHRLLCRVSYLTWATDAATMINIPGKVRYNYLVTAGLFGNTRSPGFTPSRNRVNIWLRRCRCKRRRHRSAGGGSECPRARRRRSRISAFAQSSTHRRLIRSHTFKKCKYTVRR